MRKNNGITLISLVITIVLMLILAGVTIKLVVTDELFEYASNAVGDTRNAMEQEQELINDIMNNHIKPHTKKDEGTKTGAPTLAVTEGTEGNNGWYRSNVTVTITPQSGTSKTTYVVEGAQTVTETEGTSVTITAEGESTIIAYAHNSKDEKIASESLTIKKDSIAPTFDLETSLSGNVVTWNVTNLTDNASGLTGIVDGKVYNSNGGNLVTEFQSVSGSTSLDGGFPLGVCIEATLEDNAGNVASCTKNTGGRA